MIDSGYTSFRKEQETVENLFNVFDYEKLSEKQKQEILSLYQDLEKFAPQFIQITLFEINQLKKTNNYQEPYKLYYDKALQDLEGSLLHSFSISARAIENIRIFNLEKKRPPYLILSFKQLLNKLWKTKF